MLGSTVKIFGYGNVVGLLLYLTLNSCVRFGYNNIVVALRPSVPAYCYILPPFQNIRCFRFVKQMYLDIF
jgi:hypothetical protein